MKRSLILTALSFLVLAQLAWAQVPQTINYQGVLRDGGGNIVENGTYYVTFSIYDAVGATTPAWTSGSKGVSVTNGVFSVILGQDTSLPESFPSPAWLGIKVKPDTDEMPRIELTAVPFALQAGELNMPTTERWISIPGVGFHSHWSSYRDSSYCIYHTDSNNEKEFYAPLHLPHGATIVQIEAAIKDTGANNMNIRLVSVDFAYGIEFSLAWNSSVGSGVDSLINILTPSHVVDNQRNIYLVKAAWTAPPWNSLIWEQNDVTLRGVRIKYTVDQPLP